MSFNPVLFTVTRWQLTTITFILMIVLGVYALKVIPKTEDPHFPTPAFRIATYLPGTEPVDIEALVTEPIEDTLNELDNVRKITSYSTTGISLISLEFEWTEDPERKYDEVVGAMNALRSRLPSTIERVEVNRFRTSEASIRQVALVSKDLPWRQLNKLGFRLQEKIDRVSGVQKTSIWGVPKTELRVAVNPEKLHEYNIPLISVVKSLTLAGYDTPIGKVHFGERELNVKVQGSFQSIDTVKSIPVKTDKNRVIEVGDIANVHWNYETPNHLMRFNGDRALVLSVSQKDSIDTIKLTRLINEELKIFEASLPANVILKSGFSQSENISHRFKRLKRDFLIALCLVLITLLPLGIRAGVVVMLSIPLSLLLAIFLLNLAGFTLNQLSIAGLILSLGLLVDDSIVVTENISRHLRMGKNRIASTVEGTKEIVTPVIGCTIVLLLAFLPLMVLPGGAGAFIKSLPLAVILSVSMSLIISLTIIPFLASILLSKSQNKNGNIALRAIMKAIDHVYKPLLHWSLNRPYRTICIIFMLCSFTIPIYKSIGSSLFPTADTPQFLIRIENDVDSSLQRTDLVLRKVEEVLNDEEKVKWYFSNLGRGNPRIYYNVRQKDPAANFAEIFVQLHSWEGLRTSSWFNDLRENLNEISGSRITILTFTNGSPINAPIDIRVSGPSLTKLNEISNQIETIMRSVPGTRDIKNSSNSSRVSLNLGIDVTKAAMHGVDVGAIKTTARTALSGETVANFRDLDGDIFPVKVRLPLNERHELSVIRRINIMNNSGQSVPLHTLSAPSLETFPAIITRFQRERFVSITAHTDDHYLTSNVNSDIIKQLEEKLIAPPGYSIFESGQAEAKTEGFSGVTTAGLIAVFGIFAVLVFEFGKFRTALVVASIIPLGLFGALAALYLTGHSLSFTAAIGIIALIGIEIKNSILLVDFTESLYRDGTSLKASIEQAGQVRFFPVLLTTATAIGGLLPLALEGSGLFSPMAIAIMGGLLVSTFISRIATPVMYYLLVRGEED